MSDMSSFILAPELIDLFRHSLEHRKPVAGSGDVVVDTNTPLDYCRVSFGSRLPNKLYLVYPDQGNVYQRADPYIWSWHDRCSAVHYTWAKSKKLQKAYCTSPKSGLESGFWGFLNTFSIGIWVPRVYHANKFFNLFLFMYTCQGFYWHFICAYRIRMLFTNPFNTAKRIKNVGHFIGSQLPVA